jgi:hypothetical protein
MLQALGAGLLALCPTAIHAQGGIWQASSLQTYMKAAVNGHPTAPQCNADNTICSAQCVQPPTNCEPSAVLLTVQPGAAPNTTNLSTAIPASPGGEIDANEYVKVSLPPGDYNMFTFAFEVSVPPGQDAYVNSLEFDFFQYIGQTWFNFSSRCLYAPTAAFPQIPAQWQIWNIGQTVVGPTGEVQKWANSGIPCVHFGPGWHKVVWQLKTLPAATPQQSQVCYLSLTIDGVTTPVPLGPNNPAPAVPKPDTDPDPYATNVTVNFALNPIHPSSPPPGPSPGAISMDIGPVSVTAWYDGTNPTSCTQHGTAALSLNSAAFQTGQTLIYQATLSPGPGAQPPVDIYLGAVTPDGLFVSLISVPPNGIGATAGASPTPFATNAQIAQPMNIPFTYTFTGGELPGTYFGYAEIVPAGGPPLQPLSLNIAPFQFTP